MTRKKKVDRRTQRTHRNLTHAMVELVTEKRFDDITVQNLIDRADIGRSTFYTHFRDKEDLFQQNWERFLDFCTEQIDWSLAGKGSFMPVVFLFAHLREVQPFYQGLVRSRKSDALFKSGMERLSQRIAEALKTRMKPSPPVPLAVLANYLASELLMLLKWWLDERMPYSPESMDEIFHGLVNPAMKSALGS
jgi:AcrR family transcriptional regulator